MHESHTARDHHRYNQLVATYLAQTRPFDLSRQRSSHQGSNSFTGPLRPTEQSETHDVAYMSARPSPPPVQPQHRVYVLRCAHCDTFISDRGMRAVLLLRPDITLFSTDASPSSCGALYSGHDWEPESDTEQVERTCDCLTQSLGCFCCGNIIGYQIVVPCSRCTATVGRNSQRASNGHRYVFHHNEVTYSERKFRTGEQGISTGYLQSIRSATSTPRRSPSPTFQHSQFRTESESKESPYPASLVWRTAASTISRVPRTRCRHLRLNDTIYWHHLLPAGELSSALDPRLRSVPCLAAGR